MVKLLGMEADSYLEALGPVAVVLYDGTCGFCQYWIQFILKRDKKARFRFAALESPLGLKLRELYGIPESVDSIIFIEGGRVAVRSDAVIAIFRRLPYLWPTLQAIRVVPKPLRDWIYNEFAKRRGKLSGLSRFCHLPTAEEKSRFLQMP